MKEEDYLINFYPPDLIDIFQQKNNSSILSPTSNKPITPIPKEKERKKVVEELQQNEEVFTQSQETIIRTRTKKKKKESNTLEVEIDNSQKSSQTDVQSSQSNSSQKSIPNFDEMSLEELKKELSKFGVKSGKKKYMVDKLTQIYNAIYNK